MAGVKKLDRGMVTNIYNGFGEKLYFIGLDAFMVSGGVPCVILASDPKNGNTFGRYTQEFLAIRGYAV